MSPFDEIIDRKNTDSVKWDMAIRQYKTQDLIPMWIADMDFKAPVETVEALKKCADFGVFGYTECPERVKSRIEEWLIKRYGWQISDDHIIISHNVVSSISLSIRALTNSGDKILVFSPVYNPFFEQVIHLERCPVYSELIYRGNRYFMDFDDIERKILNEDVRCLLICSPHNPGGREWDVDELNQLVRLSERFGIPIISDEIHSDLMLHAKKHTPIAKLAKESSQNIVTLMAPTKTFNLAGIGPSYILSFNKKTTEKIIDLQRLMVYPGINRFQIEALCTSYTVGDRWLKSLIPYLESNISLVTERLSEIPELEIMNQDAGYLMWVNYAALGLEETVLEKEFIHSGVLPQMGGLYGSGGHGYIRINVAAPRKIVSEGSDRMVQAFKRCLTVLNNPLTS